MTCPDAATLAEVSALIGGDTPEALEHMRTCPDCQASLRLCDGLAMTARPIDVSAALYDRLDEAIGMAAGATDIPAASLAPEVRWPWHSRLLAAVTLGVSLALLAAIAPSTSSRQVDWPALIILSALGGLVLPFIARRSVR